MKLAIIGLGVMGRNLALNFHCAGHEVAVWDPWPQARSWHAPGITVCESLEGLAAGLDAPRTVLAMVKAGEPLTALIHDLISVLDPGDTVIDGGNSDFRDTQARAAVLGKQALNFAGLGVSGGAEGARHGPSLMLGCPVDTRVSLVSLLSTIAARHEGAACLAWFGTGGAGHFVKTVHNGIEYAIMQAIAESCALLQATGMSPRAAGDTLACWQEGELNGYLMEISAEVLRTTDSETGQALLDIVDDAAGQKGTGSWCVATALDLGVPVPAIAEAVAVRQISSHSALRHRGVSTAGKTGVSLSTQDIHDGLGAAMATALAQGIHLLEAGSVRYNWAIELQDVAGVWRSGSILRMALLDLMADPAATGAFVARRIGALRRTVGQATQAGVPVSVLASCLTYHDACHTPRLPTALVQLQRDRFGAHGLKRQGEDGVFHGPWHSGDP